MNQYANIHNPTRANWYTKVIKKHGSNRLYLRLTYFDQIFICSTGLPDTKENRADLEKLADKHNFRIANDDFAFAKAFPGAPEEKKRFFSSLEDRNYSPEPSDVTFFKAFELWKVEAYPNLPTASNQRDVLSPLQSRIIPYFGDWTLDKITADALQTFLRKLARPDETFNATFVKEMNHPQKIKTTPLSQKRIKTILYAFRAVWVFISEKYGWNIALPFADANKYIEKITQKESVELDVENLSNEELDALFNAAESAVAEKNIIVMLLSEALLIISFLPNILQPPARLMLLTGMIASEIAALKNAQYGQYLHIRMSITRKKLNHKPKNLYRLRNIPITHAINQVLTEARALAKGTLLFRGITGEIFNEKIFRDHWYKACDRAGVKRIKPYALRHTFVANCEVLDIPRYRIVDLMGHADKSMIDRVYGKYRDGIEGEKDLILTFYGSDFVTNSAVTNKEATSR